MRITTRAPGHEIIRWRYVTILVPPTIVVAAAAANASQLGPASVQVLPASIAPAEPVGHLHVHLGPMLPFEVLWMDLWHAFLRRGCLDAPGGNGIETIADVPEIAKMKGKRRPGLRWKWILEQAFAARLWLDEAKLWVDEQSPDLRPAPTMVRRLACGDVDHRHRTSELLRLWMDDRFRREARRRAGANERIRDEARRRERPSGARRGPNAEPSPSALRAEEVAFLSRGLRRCSEDDSYARIFYQYLRVKVALYQQLRVDPWTTGLRHFLDVVQRDSPYLNVTDERAREHDLRLMAGRDEAPLNVEALEIHIAPQKWLKRRDTLQRGGRLGWVLSFVRADQPKGDDPTGAKDSRKWRRRRMEIGTLCRTVRRVMEARPSVLRQLRAVSLMDWERNGPVWLYEDSLQRLVRRSQEMASQHPRLGIQPLRTAYHLGEDFDHLLSGLRQIYEPFEWEMIGRGDRIGHALALGLKATDWCTRVPWVQMRPWDRLLDVGFVYWAFENAGLAVPGHIIEQLRTSAANMMTAIFHEDERDPLALARNIWRVLPTRVPRLSRAAAGERTMFMRARQLRDRVLDDRMVGRRALAQSLAVQTQHDLETLELVQRLVTDTLAKWQVAIEVNPSSNLLIGGLRSIFEQPVFHTDELPIILNVDDPLTFATTLADDYAYAWAGMVIGAGTPPFQATRRLEEAARNSMRYAFTTPAADEPDERRTRSG